MRFFGWFVLVAAVLGIWGTGAVVLRDPTHPLWAIGAQQICTGVASFLIGGRVAFWTIREFGR